jgi:NAD(P)-dependent dehydrogenase (short-subunit alcohol dehydrogenase family)
VVAVANGDDVADFAGAERLVQQAVATFGGLDRTRSARVINTSSGAGLQGSVGQATYSAAKADIAGLTLVAAHELARYGVAVNAIAPTARTRMTGQAFADSMAAEVGAAVRDLLETATKPEPAYGA